MVTPINILTQQNWQKSLKTPSGGNSINYSDLNQVAFQLGQGRCAIKYVLHGQEHYRVNGHEYGVRSGEYLLINPDCHGNGWVDSNAQVRGICINLEPAMMAEVAATMLQPGEPQSSGRWEHTAMQKQVFRGQQSHLSRFLQQFGQQINQSMAEGPACDASLYFSLCELYLSDLSHFSKQLGAIKAVKTATKQELYRRLQEGRSFMEDTITRPMDIADIARNACLSEYQFFRLFKSVFGITPYQFMLQKRLELGHEMLLKSGNSVSDVALSTGFADIFSFSKAFKKRFGVSPSSISVGSK